MAKDLITSSDLQVKYEHLYSFLMNYLWEFTTVQALADLEIAVFQRFPDKEEMLKCLKELKTKISATYNELAEDDEEEFKETFDDLEQAIEEYDPENTGCELYAVEEFIDNKPDVTGSEDMNIPEGKRKFEFGEIRKTTKEERELQEEAAHTLSNPFENKTEEGEEE